MSSYPLSEQYLTQFRLAIDSTAISKFYFQPKNAFLIFKVSENVIRVTTRLLNFGIFNWFIKIIRKKFFMFMGPARPLYLPIVLPMEHTSMHVVYFNQLLDASRTQKLVETFFSSVFQPFLCKVNFVQSPLLPSLSARQTYRTGSGARCIKVGTKECNQTPPK